MSDSLVIEFLMESMEGLDRLDRDFVALEKDPENPELLGAIFRVIHTIKGSCGFLGFAKLEGVAHAGESLLALMRDGKLHLTKENTNVLLSMVDAIRSILHNIEATGTEEPAEYGELLKELQQAQTGTCAPRTGNEDSKREAAHLKRSVKPNRIGGLLVKRKVVQADDVIRALELQEQGDRRRLGEILIHLGVLTDAQLNEILGDKGAKALGDATIRVDVNLLEKQMNLVSELVLLRNRLLQVASRFDDHALNTATQGLNFITSELRRNVMKTRMQPVNSLYERFPRLVRDVASSLGKSVRLETQGGETELDKTLLEAIRDPVTHIVRNAVDHGIETPEQRRAKGKADEGVLVMKSYHEGGHFHLELADDGAGIDLERVKQKAISQGLVNAAEAEKLTEEQIREFLFAPGFSTASKVTSVSGRGVGMDVVRTNIKQINGTVKLISLAGKGTTIHMEIPLTLATIPALIVRCGKSVFAVPQGALVELVRLSPEEVTKRVEVLDGVQVYRFRGTILPLIRLRGLLNLHAQEASQEGEEMNIAVLRTEGRQISLEVDQIQHAEEIVVKPMGIFLRGIDLFAGAAVLGDGRVALILDVAAVARRSGVSVIQEDRSGESQDAAEKKAEMLPLLLLGGKDGERMAMPLSFVRRMEELPESSLERMGGRDVVQYRGDILRLVHLEELLEERRKSTRTNAAQETAGAMLTAVVVAGKGRKDTLLQVSKIVGIAYIESSAVEEGGRRGVCGSAAVQGRATEILDVKKLLEIADEIRNEPPEEACCTKEEAQHVN